MTLLIHILIALSSIVLGTFVAFRPSQTKLRALYVLAGATVITGVYLGVVSPAHMAQVCTSGLMYLAAITVAILAARHKLARAAASK